jgi:hypothetical protein
MHDESQDNREHRRQPTDMPVSVEYDLSGLVACRDDYLNNVSAGGLSFKSARPLRKGVEVSIAIPLARPVFRSRGRVVWCRQTGDRFDIGVAFCGREDPPSDQFIEQVCDIERYKEVLSATEGRPVTGEEAALEWLRQHESGSPS